MLHMEKAYVEVTETVRRFARMGEFEDFVTKHCEWAADIPRALLLRWFEYICWRQLAATRPIATRTTAATGHKVRHN